MIGGWDVAHDPRAKNDGFKAVSYQGPRLKDEDAPRRVEWLMDTTSLSMELVDQLLKANLILVLNLESSESSTNPISTNTKIRNRRRSKPRVEPFSIVEIPVVTMADNRTMEEMLQAPTEGYGDAIAIPDILTENFEIRTGLLSLIQANQFHGFESNNPHDRIRSFNRITSTLKFSDVSNDA
nr:reverse transcriptase domain-containing protein [Tanacetum cinerariifolium]